MDRRGTGPQAGLPLDNMALKINPRNSLQINCNENHTNNHTKEARANERLESPGHGALGASPGVSERQMGRGGCRENVNQ